MVALLLIICCLLFVPMAAAAVVSYKIYRGYQRFKADLTEQINEFITSPGKDEKQNPLPSPFAQSVDLIAQSIAARMSQSFHAMLQGQASGMARGLKAVQGELIETQIAQTGNPLTMALAGIFGKQLKKNPMMAMALQGLPNILGNNNNGNHAQPQSGSDDVNYRITS